MKYLELSNQFWAKDVEHHFSDREIALYFYLLNVCNSGKLRNPFKLSNNVTVARLGWGKASFDRTRKKLMDAGLIDFRQGLGRGNVSQYIIKEAYSSSEESSVQVTFVDSKNAGEKDIQKGFFLEQFSEVDNKKEVVTDDFLSENGVQSDGFLSENIEKVAQADSFSEAKNDTQALEIKTFQPIETPKNEKSLFAHNNNIYNSNNILDNNTIENKNNKNSNICANNETCPERSERENENLKDGDVKNEKQKENEVVELFRRICRSFPQIMRMTSQRKDKIIRRLSEMGGMKNLEKIFQKMEASEFLKGNNKYGWQATFDWVFKNSDNWIKILEGNYDNRIPKPQLVRPSHDMRFTGMLSTDLSKW